MIQKERERERERGKERGKKRGKERGGGNERDSNLIVKEKRKR